MNFVTRRKQRRVIFFISLLAFLGLWILLGLQSVVSFDYFDQWTVQQNVVLGEGYVKDSSVDNAVVGTTLSQLSFGNGSYKVRLSTDNTDELFLQSQILVNTDILNLINSSQDTNVAIKGHIAHTDKTIAQIEAAAQAHTSLAEDYLSKSKQCLANKRRGDATFYKGAQQSDTRLWEEGLAMSLEYAPCYITNRINANAQAYLAQKVQTNAYLLQQRSSLLTKNKDLLVSNKAYLEGNVLEDLLLVKRQLQTVNSSSYEQFSSSFSFDYLGFNYELPTYDNFVIWPDHIPTYQEPGLDGLIG